MNFKEKDRKLLSGPKANILIPETTVVAGIAHIAHDKMSNVVDREQINVCVMIQGAKETKCNSASDKQTAEPLSVAATKVLLKEVRKMMDAGETNLDLINERLKPTDLYFEISSPSESLSPEQISTHAKEFWNLLANSGKDKETGIPYIKPAEVKSAEAFQSEILNNPQDRMLILMRDANGKVIDGIYSPQYDVTDAQGQITRYATLEYQASEGSHHGKGLGLTAASLYKTMLAKQSETQGKKFGGILIEAVATAGRYWEKVGAKSIYFFNAIGKAIKIDYAMPPVEFDPKTGKPTSTDILREDIKLVLPEGKNNITVGELKALITAFYKTSYMPSRENFESDAAYQVAFESVQKTLQNICLKQFDGFPDDTILHTKYNEELEVTGKKIVKPWILTISTKGGTS